MDIWRLKLAFLSPIRHNLATHEGSENLVVKVTTDGSRTGFGEGVPRAFVTGETLPESLAFLRKVLAPGVMDRALASPGALLEALTASYEQGAGKFPGAFCALETALLDAGGKTWSRSVADLIGPPVTESVVYSAIIPLASIKQMAQFFDLVQAYRIRFIKLKVGTPGDLKVLRMAREKLGWEVDLRVDANSAWEAAEAIDRIREMQPYGISAVEQPVPKEDFEGLKRVSDAVDIPIIADESLCNEGDAQRLIALQACRIFNIRLSKCGGFKGALRIRDLAAKAGILCQLGCHVGETSILAAAGRHFALCSPELVYVEGSLGPFLLTRDPVARPVVFDKGGVAHALPGPGLGVDVLEEVLDELAVSRHTIG